MLCLADIGVSQHLRDTCHRYVMQQGKRGGKCVSCNVIGQLFVDAAHGGEFFQVLVDFLIASYGKQASAGLLSTIFV